MTLCKSIRMMILVWAIVFAAHQVWGRTLIIHSYHEQYDWVQGVNEGLLTHMRPDTPHRIFYMDTKRRPGVEWKRESAQIAKKLIAEYAPSVIIAVDDNAQEYVVRQYAGNSPIQFVFTGVNSAPEAYGYPSNNVTGILERAYPKQVFQMLQKIQPKVNKVVWVSDNSPTAHGTLPRVKELAESRSLPVQIADFVLPDTFEQWQKTIEKYNKRTDIHAFLIPLYHTVKEKKDGKSMLPSIVMRWTVDNTDKPVVGFWPFSPEDGALCSVSVDPHEHGERAAWMAKEILAGKKASDIPIMTNQNGYVIVNLKSANRLGINVPFEVIQSADRVIE